MDSCEWKLTDGELAEIKEKRIAELTAEVDRLQNLCFDCDEERRNEINKNQRLRHDYNDLIMQVACAFPNESCHETAKRYIMERENRESVGTEKQTLEGEE